MSADSIYYAKEVAEKIMSRTEYLKKFPEFGRIVPEIGNKNIRELIIYSYRLIYEISKNNIDILTIIHGKQEFPNNFK